MQVESELTYNGKSSLPTIYAEMQKTWDAVGKSYKSKTNRSLLDIRFSLRKANESIYRRALARAPVIKADIKATEPEYRQEISLRDKSGLREGSAMSRKLQSRGVVARRIVGSKGYASQYIAAIEYGRDEFVQPRTKIVGDRVQATFRTIGKARPQPFLRQSLYHGAQGAYDIFSTTLEKRWTATMRRVARRNQN